MSSATYLQGTDPRHAHITVDVVAKILKTTILHPFVAWMIPLSLRAQATPYTHVSFQISTVYAALLTLLWILSVINKRIAYGLPREVDFSEEVIVITGGASGLGLLIAEVYGMRGASVAVLDVKRLEDEDSRGVKFYQCDIGDREQVQRAARQIEDDIGVPTILINNAGIVNGKPLLELSPAEVDRNFRVNLLSHFHTIQAFLPGMLAEDRGTIVTVSSVLGYLGCANLSDYTASKSALLALHASLVAELQYSPHPSAQNIRTILVTPGQLATPMFSAIRTPSSFFGPVIEPVDIAKEIIKMVDAGESGEIAMPLYARWIQWIGVLPVGVRRIVRTLSGLDRAAVEGFRRRSGDGKVK